MMKQLTRCVNCDEVFLKTPFDRHPEYGLSLTPSSFQVVERNDFGDFLGKHHGHRMEALEVVEDSYISEKPYSEPVKVSYFKATNGKERFVIKRSRERIDEPLVYQLIHGDYSLRCIGIEIQSKEIAKQLKSEFRTRPLSEEKIAAFLRLYQQIAETVSVDKLERVPEESPLPLEIYYAMDDVTLVYLLRNCRNLFKGQEYSDIETFIQRHKDNGVLLLKGTHQIEITERLRAKRDIPSARLAEETAKRAEKK